MIIMAAENDWIDAPGCLCIYFNEASAYCYQGEICCGIGFWNWNAGDIDNDGNTELMIEVLNGGRETVILKYRNETFEEMNLPKEMGEKYYWGINVCAEINYKESTYSASGDFVELKIKIFLKKMRPEAVLLLTTAGDFINTDV